jgi:serine protease Do
MLKRLYVLVSFFILSSAPLNLHAKEPAPNPTGIDHPNPLKDGSNYSSRDVFEKIKGSIVGIQAIQKRNDLGSQVIRDMDMREFFNRFYPDSSALLEGDCLSGVAVDAGGLVLTLLEPVKEAEKIFVIFPDGRKEEAVIKGEDERLNLVLLKVDSKLSSIAAVSKNGAQIGDSVIAAGSPFGLSDFGNFVTAGIVSAVNQKLPQSDYFCLLQTDAKISPLNNGGPLVNDRGELIGINLYVKEQTPLYYCVFVNSGVIESLKKHRNLQYGWIGMRVQEDFKGNLRTLTVVDIENNGPAYEAGFLERDIIKSFNGEMPRGVKDLSGMVAMAEVGSRASIDIIRNDKEINLYVNIEPKPKVVK